MVNLSQPIVKIKKDEMKRVNVENKKGQKRTKEESKQLIINWLFDIQIKKDNTNQSSPLSKYFSSNHEKYTMILINDECSSSNLSYELDDEYLIIRDLDVPVKEKEDKQIENNIIAQQQQLKEPFIILDKDVIFKDPYGQILYKFSDGSIKYPYQLTQRDIEMLKKEQDKLNKDPFANLNELTRQQKIIPLEEIQKRNPEGYNMLLLMIKKREMMEQANREAEILQQQLYNQQMYNPQQQINNNQGQINNNPSQNQIENTCDCEHHVHDNNKNDINNKFNILDNKSLEIIKKARKTTFTVDKVVDHLLKNNIIPALSFDISNNIIFFKVYSNKNFYMDIYGSYYDNEDKILIPIKNHLYVLDPEDNGDTPDDDMNLLVGYVDNRIQPKAIIEASMLDDEIIHLNDVVELATFPELDNRYEFFYELNKSFKNINTKRRFKCVTKQFIDTKNFMLVDINDIINNLNEITLIAFSDGVPNKLVLTREEFNKIC